MKRYGLVLALLVVVTTVPCGGQLGPITLDPPDFGTPEWFEWWQQEYMPGSPTAPSFPEIDMPLPAQAEVTLTITPSEPTEGDAVTATVSCSPVGYYYVDRADLQVRGALITLDLYWQDAVFFAPIDELRHIQPLGTFDPGTYTLLVRNHGPFSGMATTSFTVTALEPDNGDDPTWPSWWSSFHSGTSPW